MQYRIIAPRHSSTHLTAREREVAKWLAEGKTVQDVATILNISPHTVEVHKFNLMQKMDVVNRAELVLAAIRMHIIPCPCQENAHDSH